MKHRVVIEQDEDGFFVVEAPELPGCVTQGRTREEALENIKDAIQAYLQYCGDLSSEPKSSIQETVIEIIDD